MLSDTDRNWLERAAGRDGSAAEKLLLFGAIFLVVAGSVNLILAVRIADLSDYSLAQIARGWLAGIELDRLYPGVYLKAVERLTVATLQWGLAASLALAFAGKRTTRRRHQRILQALQE
ncbi:MAG: hypothetical protein ACK47B_05465 [Armatimonadota bacterium]